MGQAIIILQIIYHSVVAFIVKRGRHLKVDVDTNSSAENLKVAPVMNLFQALHTIYIKYLA